MNMLDWMKEMKLAHDKKPFPVLSFPGLEMTGDSVLDAVTDGSKQADGVCAIARRYPEMAGAVTFMDLSVEAEAFGSQIRFSEDEVPTVLGRLVTSEEDAANLSVPEVGRCRTGEYLNAVRLSKQQIGDRPVFAGMIGPYSLTGRLMDMTELMVGMSEEPEMVHAVLEKATRFLISYACAFRDAGADGLVIAEPAAGLISPAQSKEFAMNYVTRIVEAVQRDDFAVILHNCGNTTGMVHHMAGTGAMGLHFGNAVEMSDILPQVPPDVLAFGNLDPAGVLKHGTVQNVRDGVVALKKLEKVYPNFILSSGCDIPPGTPMENLDAFFAAASTR